jgi:hypothetical protein
VAEQDVLEEDEEATEAAVVVFGACVGLLRASPGNCTAVCGLTDGEALMPAVESDEEPDEEPGPGTANVVGTVEVGTLNGSDAGTDWSAVAGDVTGAVFFVAGTTCGLV